MYLKFGGFLLMCTVVTAHFSYNGNKGPAHWEDDYATCKGKHQSPINIDVLHVKKVKLPPLIFNNFDIQPLSTTVKNTGHTVMFTIEVENGKEPIIDGGPFNDGGYVFEQLHFHWGDNDSYGSEDSLDGKHFPMELHVLFYKQKYGSQEQAMNYPDGLVVMAFFFIISNKPNPSYVEVTKILRQITNPNTKMSFEEPLALEDYLHTNMQEYYVYNGSLTTPPCLDKWSHGLTFMNQLRYRINRSIFLSHPQLDYFRSLKDLDGNLISHNFRPVQPIGDRIVWLTSEKFTKADIETQIKSKTQKPQKKEKKKRRNKGSIIVLQLPTLIFIIVVNILLQ